MKLPLISLLPHKHKNLILLILGIILSIVILRQPTLHNFLLSIGNYGYFGAFLAGLLFVSTFTVATGAMILITLSETLLPIELIFFAVLGAAVSDFLIFKFVKDDVEEEIGPIYQKIEGTHLKKLLHTRYFGWTLPFIGAIIMISPLPDELGVSLMGLSNVNQGKFILFSLASHTVGMTIFVTAASLL